MTLPLIMLVEDDDGIREAYSDVLLDEGYRVCECANGREAIEALDSSEAPTLILLDWMMPIMSGEQFIQSDCGVQAAKNCPVVVISAVAGKLGVVPGVRECISKPIDLDRLLETVSHYCGLNII